MQQGVPSLVPRAAGIYVVPDIEENVAGVSRKREEGVEEDARRRRSGKNMSFRVTHELHISVRVLISQGELHNGTGRLCCYSSYPGKVSVLISLWPNWSIPLHARTKLSQLGTQKMKKRHAPVHD
jgi:hypothetical protein